MENKGLLQNIGGWAQFFFFFFLSISGMMFFALIVTLVMSPEQMTQSAPSLRLAQTLQAVCMFMVPAFVFAFLCCGNAKIYLKADVSPNLQVLALAVVLIIVIQPVINCIGYYNQQIALPESLSWMKEMEDSAEKSLKLLFADRSIMVLIFNLLVIALVAGLAEELFFRGCLQQIMQKITGNRHAAVWIAAIIFSAIHFQFYGFVPRVLLGALLGYLFVWSGSIWLPVIIHTIHNALNVVLIYIYPDASEAVELGGSPFSENILLITCGLILSVIIIFLLYRKRQIDVESAN